jgi:hypothetical protein
MIFQTQIHLLHLQASVVIVAPLTTNYFLDLVLLSSDMTIHISHDCAGIGEIEACHTNR